MPSSILKNQVAVIGAGKMGSGIALKFALAGFRVIMVDREAERIEDAFASIQVTLDEAVSRGIFTSAQTEQAFGNIVGTAELGRVRDADFIIEAVFEDGAAKASVLQELADICKLQSVVVSNTSSFGITSLGDAFGRPGDFAGMHFFYPPVKNRLVEIISGRYTSRATIDLVREMSAEIDATSIGVADSPGFAVNRFFVPWLNESVRLLDEGVGDIASIETAAKDVFGIDRGPFELMNITGVDIACHAMSGLGEAFGGFYLPSELIKKQVASGVCWGLTGEPGRVDADEIAARLFGVVCFIARQIVEERIATAKDVDLGARVGLRWPKGPFEMMAEFGEARVGEYIDSFAGRHQDRMRGS